MSVERKRCKVGNFYLDYFEINGQSSTQAPLSTWSWSDFKKNLIGKKVLAVESIGQVIHISFEDMHLAIIDSSGRDALSCNGVTVIGEELAITEGD